MAGSRTPPVQGIPAQRESGAEQSPAPGQGTLTRDRRAASGLVTDQGRTTIAAEAVAKIAGVAAREISGVHDFGTGTARAFGALKGRLGVEVTEVNIAVDDVYLPRQDGDGETQATPRVE